MFNLETPSIKWAIQVLTLDYLIDGSLDADRDKYSFRLLGHDVSPLPVTSARFRPTGALSVSPPPATPWVLIYGDQLVAIIPKDDAGLTNARQLNAAFKVAVPAEVYAGPYVIRGQVLSPDGSLRVFEGYTGFPVQDAEIKCLIPGAQLGVLKAPYVLVMSRHKQALVPIK
ncbi:MAG: hypothetical protein ABSG01_13305 [Anaerolineales bacterium]|jgi:hypothetical protein